MLKTMRKNVKALKPTLWIIIATFIIAIFAIWGGAGRLGEATTPARSPRSAASASPPTLTSRPCASGSRR